MNVVVDEDELIADETQKNKASSFIFLGVAAMIGFLLHLIVQRIPQYEEQAENLVPYTYDNETFFGEVGDGRKWFIVGLIGVFLVQFFIIGIRTRIAINAPIFSAVEFSFFNITITGLAAQVIIVTCAALVEGYVTHSIVQGMTTHYITNKTDNKWLGGAAGVAAACVFFVLLHTLIYQGELFELREMLRWAFISSVLVAFTHTVWVEHARHVANNVSAAIFEDYTLGEFMVFLVTQPVVLIAIVLGILYGAYRFVTRGERK